MGTIVSFVVLSILNIIPIFHDGILAGATAVSNGGTPVLVTVAHTAHSIVVSVL